MQFFNLFLYLQMETLCLVKVFFKFVYKFYHIHFWTFKPLFGFGSWSGSGSARIHIKKFFWIRIHMDMIGILDPDPDQHETYAYLKQCLRFCSFTITMFILCKYRNISATISTIISKIQRLLLMRANVIFPFYHAISKDWGFFTSLYCH